MSTFNFNPHDATLVRVLHWNSCMDWACFWHTGFPRLILHCVLGQLISKN